MDEVFITAFYGQVMAKKNAKTIRTTRNGRRFIGQTDEAKLQERDMVWAFATDFKNQGIKPELWRENKFGITVEVWNKDHRKHDLDNQLATIMDALVKAGVLPDDNQETVMEETIKYRGVDRDDPRAEITIYPIRFIN